MPIVSRVYAIPPAQVKLQKYRVTAGVVTLFVAVPLSTALVGFCLPGGHQSLSAQEMARPMVGLTIVSAALWLRMSTLKSLRIELDDERITQTQSRPLRMPPLKISFARQDIAHIREVRKEGLYIHGRGSNGKYIELHIPRTVENYDDLRSRIAAWHPIRDAWL
jgi:hypothetical protein